jgi:uridine kinase
MELTAALLDLCKESSQPIIAIDGPAGAGKTTLANNLALALASDYTVHVVHMDNLYDGWDRALSPQLTQSLNFISSSHKAGKKISYSSYNWSTEEFDEAKEIPQANLIIFEGVGSGQRSIRSEISALIWIDIAEDEGLARVLERDGTAIKNQMEKWLTQQDEHFRAEGTQNAADFVLTT